MPDKKILQWASGCSGLKTCKCREKSFLSADRSVQWYQAGKRSDTHEAKLYISMIGSENLPLFLPKQTFDIYKGTTCIEIFVT